nr:IS5 family transposase [Teredinibacter purpureus]
MKQQSLEASGFEKYRKKTRKEIFLDQMNEILPWEELCEAIEPFYPKASSLGGRPTIGIERMLRIHFLQHWFELSDPSAEEALYDSRAMRQFVGIDLGKEPVPDETTMCKFRHLMERHNLGGELFRLVNAYLQENGLKLNRGTIVDATIIDAPRSTKNKARQRDPDMKSTQKGGQWYFGMKAHIGVDSQTKLIHSVRVTSANVHDSQVLGDLLHGEGRRVYGDSAYTGQKSQIKASAQHAKDFTHKRGRRNHPLTNKERQENRNKSKIRPRVEHLFGVIKHQFGFRKVRYKGLAKNAQAVFTKCALTNLFLARRHLMTI